MSSLKLYNSDAGPLKLEYDPRPRDVETENLITNRPMYRRDFRYHGYPEESFFRPKPRNKRPLSDEEKILREIEESEKPSLPHNQNRIEDHRQHYDSKYYYKPSSHHQGPPNHHHMNQQKQSSDNTYLDISAKNNFMEKSPFQVEKLKRERRDAEEDVARFKAEQARKLREAQEEKRKEYERVTKYYIWDSFNQGHGAPKDGSDHRKQKFTEEDFSSKEQQPYKDTQARKGQLLGGAGAPLQTNSGTPQTHIKIHPSIHFQNKENHPPAALTEQLKNSQHGPEKEQYGRELLRQLQERELSEQEKKIQELKREIEMLKGGDPYGKPGGGAPQKSQSGHKVMTHLKSYHSKQPAELNRIQNRASFTERTENSSVDEEKGVYPTPRRYRYNDDVSDEPYFPFGRPGAGAPILDVDGNIMTSIKNKLERNTSSAEERRKARAARMYYQELKHAEKEHKRVRQEMENEVRGPIGEFASVIKEGQVGKPKRDPITGTLLNQHLGSSDISKQKMNSQYKDEEEMRMYHDDLTRQADDRHRMRELSRLKDKQMSKQHYDVMGDYWGKFGGGAPKDPLVRKKAALEETLFSPGRPVEPKRNELHEPVADKVIPHYVRSIVPSTHKNSYDYSKDKSYSFGAPYATLG